MGTLEYLAHITRQSVLQLKLCVNALKKLLSNWVELEFSIILDNFEIYNQTLKNQHYANWKIVIRLTYFVQFTIDTFESKWSNSILIAEHFWKR